MSDNFDKVLATSENYQKQSVDVINKLFEVAEPAKTFGKPVKSGDYTIITASEAYVAMGVGFGVGLGTEKTNEGAEEQVQATDEVDGGGGGGGGGVAVGRPVAAISVGPDGVRVEPVVDVTKIALAFFTMLGSMLIMLGKMRRAGRH
jgi:uncharacterized spore protein YtfJ